MANIRFTVQCLLVCVAMITLAIAVTASPQKTLSVKPEPVPSGVWRAVLTLPGGELPFYFELQDTADGPVAFLLNGEEKIRIRDVKMSDRHLRLRLPAFNSTISAMHTDGALEGMLRLIKRGGKPQDITLHAVPVSHYLAKDLANPRVSIAGRWDATFTDDEGKVTKAIGEFTQEGAALKGTFLTPTGDYRYLAGTVAGETFSLGCFDGAHVFLFKGRVDDEGRITGNFWSGTKWHENWTAVRDESASLPDPYKQTFVRKGVENIAFRFPDTAGKQVSFPSERNKGRVVIITIEGSWCPNCHDEAAFLADFYKTHRERGLDVIGLMYEHYRDFDKAARQVDLFREKHGIEFPLLVAGYSDKKEAAATLPMLNHVMSFPTMIVIGRKGDVRFIHTAFSGPGTGAHYEAFVEEFTGLIENLLTEY